MIALSPSYYDANATTINHAMHWGQGALAATARGAMAYFGIVGAFGSFMFMGLRLLVNQTLEKWTGVGTLPWCVFDASGYGPGADVPTPLISPSHD